ncbi:MAG: PEP-utilizing enzyme [Planctomycetes bacterium]|jgi:phosphohistidine swiveling domain-containing protein|nr:PEP-utilizing enzyme [Planctomycetota bacterium]
MLEKIINSQARLKILSVFFLDVSKDFYEREIINATKLDPANIHKELLNLLNAEILKDRKKEGKKFFSLNRDNKFFPGLEKIFTVYNEDNNNSWILLEEMPDYYPMMAGVAWSANLANRYFQERGLKNRVSNLLLTFNNNLGGLYIIKKEYNQLAQELLTKIINNVKWGQNYINDLIKDRDNLVEASLKLREKNLGNLSNLEIFKVFDKYYNDTYIKLHLHHWPQTLLDFIDHSFSQFLMNYLKDKITDQYSLGEVFSILTTPTTEGNINQEYKSLLLLLNEINQQEKLKKYFKTTESRLIVENLKEVDRDFFNKLRQHVKNFGYLGYAVKGPGWDDLYFIDILSSLIRQGADAKKLFNKLQVEKNNLIQKQKTFIKLFKIDKKHQEIFTFAQNLVLTKGLRKDSMFLSYSVIENLFREIGRRFYLSLNQVRYFYCQEFKELLLKNKFSADQLNERYKFSVYYSNKDVSQDKFWEGEKAKKFFNTLSIIKEEIKNTKILVGDCACSGRARGEVRVINLVKDIGKMKQGDILVSTATNPDLMPAIKKASAIVTDIGGITCHAAIVSRELNIPCVVGTKFATRLLKDGYVIDVDATHGKVNIIKKKRLILSRKKINIIKKR